MDDDIIDLQTRLAHQEHTIAALNEALTDQQDQIGRLETLVKALIDRVQSLSDAAPGTADVDETPPHY